MSGAPRARTSPLRATVPLARVIKTPLTDCPKVPAGAPIRRTASLETLPRKTLLPRDSVFWNRDRATQTDGANSLDSIQNLGPSVTLEEGTAKLTLRPTRRSPSGDNKGGTGRNPPSPVAKGSSAVPPKSSRNSDEGLNQELELYANAESIEGDRLQEPIPEGRKAPVAELIREGPYSRIRRQPANQNSSEDSQDSSPDQERMISGSSPQINRFSSSAPPQGCEHVLSKSVPILRPIPREVVSSHPQTLFTLKPSSHSAFESLHRGMQTPEEADDDSDSPKVPSQ